MSRFNIFAIALLLVVCPAGAQPRYRFAELEVLPGTYGGGAAAISDSGLVAGQTIFDDFEKRRSRRDADIWQGESIIAVLPDGARMVRREKVLFSSGCESRPGSLLFRLVAVGTVEEATNRLKLSMLKGRLWTTQRVDRP